MVNRARHSFHFRKGDFELLQDKNSILSKAKRCKASLFNTIRVNASLLQVYFMYAETLKAMFSVTHHDW